jgi:hypothetical protein
MKLDLRDDDPVGQEVTRARLVAYRAALASLDGERSRLAEALRVELTMPMANPQCLIGIALARVCVCVR